MAIAAQTIPALAQKRLALVIGNDDYQNLPRLRKAVGDAIPIYVDANSKYTESEARTILAKIAD